MQHFSDRPATPMRARRGVAGVGFVRVREGGAGKAIAGGDAAGFFVHASRFIIGARQTEAAAPRRAVAAAAESMRNDSAFAR